MPSTPAETGTRDSAPAIAVFMARLGGAVLSELVSDTSA